MPKVLHAGGEVDAWCTKCRLVLNHRIIAMLGPNPARVECSTCMSHHNFRARAPGEKAPSAGRASGTSGPRSARPTAASKAEAAREERERSWAKAIAGKTVDQFRPFSIQDTYEEGDLLQHKKFGEGVVLRVVDVRKIEVLFKDEPRVLAHGMAG